MASITVQKISFVNKIGLILKATSDDESPTQGYLYKEINDISHESVGYCESLVDFLTDRLKSRSCNVKFKTLKLMKHVAEHGSREFQLGLRKHSDAIKECTKFGGPPHPMHGNVPYLMVRRTSKELCEVLYNLDQLNMKSPTESIGSSHRLPEPKYGGLGPVVAGGNVQGFGNTPPQPKTLGETILDGIEKLGAKMTEKPADRQAALLAKLDLSSSTINYRPPVVVSMDEPVLAPPVTAESVISKPKPVKKHQPGRAGGGWGDDDGDDDEEVNANNNDNSSNLLSFEIDSLIDPTSSRLKADELQVDWEEESELVVDMLKVGSTGPRKVFLTPSAVSAFITRCLSLSCDKVVENLAQKLDSRDAGVVLRSLQLLEGIIYNKEELVAMDHLTSICKEALVNCYMKYQSKNQTSSLHENLTHTTTFNEQHRKEQETVSERMELWDMVKVKLAKVILILQQLSSHKDILSASHFSCYQDNISTSNQLTSKTAAI